MWRVSKRLSALRASVEHLSEVAAGLTVSDYSSRAYPSEWTIADTFSHLGSGAVIGRKRFEDSVTGREVDPAFNAAVWDEWNAKEPAAQVRDALTSDAALLDLLEGATKEERAGFSLSMGPYAFDFDGFVGLRLGEHVLHTWDVEVTRNDAATLSEEAANAILDGVAFVVARAGRPTGEEKSVTVRTSDAARDFTLILQPDSVTLHEARYDRDTDLLVPAEAFVRLIYGRLDARHCPPSVNEEVVSYLRGVFPGF